MKTYLIIQYQKDKPQIFDFNNEEEMRKYLKAFRTAPTIVAITEDIYFTKIRENKVDEFHE